MRRTVATCLGLSAVLAAQETRPDPQATPPKVVSGRFGFDFTSQYFFRGLVQENQGAIWQPYVELNWGLLEGDGDLRKLDFKFGLWNSVHDEKTGGAGVWYESNFYFGVEAQIGERLTAGLTYSIYDSPNGSPTFSKNGRPVEELVFSFDYDDRGQWFESLASGLQPSLVLAVELDGQRDVINGAGHVGIYAGLGIEPSFVIGKLADGDLTFSIPTTLGLSLRDYYERTIGGGNDDFFGYLQVGAELSAPLTFLPSRMGPWTGRAGAHFLLLGDNNETRNGGDVAEVIFTLGFETVF